MLLTFSSFLWHFFLFFFVKCLISRISSFFYIPLPQSDDSNKKKKYMKLNVNWGEEMLKHFRLPGSKYPYMQGTQKWAGKRGNGFNIAKVHEKRFSVSKDISCSFVSFHTYFSYVKSKSSQISLISIVEILFVFCTLSRMRKCQKLKVFRVAVNEF